MTAGSFPGSCGGWGNQHGPVAGTTAQCAWCLHCVWTGGDPCRRGDKTPEALSLGPEDPGDYNSLAPSIFKVGLCIGFLGRL